MLSFKDFTLQIHELFDKPLKYRESIESDIIKYNFFIGDSECVVTLTNRPKHLLHIEFSVDGVITILNSKGNAIKIFSTIFEIVNKFLENNDNIKIIAFESDLNEPSRIKLYDRIVNLFKPNFVDNSRIEVYGENGKYKKYILNRK